MSDANHKDADQCCGCDEYLNLLDPEVVMESEEAWIAGAEGLGAWHPQCLRSFLRGASATPNAARFDPRLVSDLALGTRARNAVNAAGFKTIGEIATLDTKGTQRLWKVRNCGRKTVREIHEALARAGAAPTWTRP